MPNLTLLVGPPGSGKSNLANSLIYDDGDHGSATVYVSQDSQGKDHLKRFEDAVSFGKNILVDRMNFSKGQRSKYLDVAKKHGYATKIIVLHESYETCLKICLKREGHPTIKTEEDAKKSLHFFFTKYERVEDSEADEVKRYWPEGNKPQAIIVDLDGTLCNIEHRQHYVTTDGKKNWKKFFDEMSNDKPNEWCLVLMMMLRSHYNIVFCSGRPEDYRQQTLQWIKNVANISRYSYDHLFMRSKNDSRKDSIVKEIILDFELLTRYSPYLFIDDRSQVVQMYRKRGYTVLQCADGNF